MSLSPVKIHVSFLFQGFSIACMALHYYSFDDRDILTSFLATGTFSGYIVVIVGVFAGEFDTGAHIELQFTTM